ncbi:MAG: hypothetical protein H0W24_00975 [Lysobacter sp.]|nr:hypothetical protein [Lysobacter sp.]
MRPPGRRLQTRTGGLAWLLLALASLAALVYGATALTAPPSVDVLVRLAKTTEGKVQLFAGTGAGYQEQRSVTLPSASDGAFREYPLRLSDPASFERFRMDPGSGTGRVIIDRIDIISAAGTTRLDGARLRGATTPLNQLLAEPADGEVSFQSLGADPFLEVALPDTLLREHDRLRQRHQLLVGGGAAALLLLLWIARARARAAVVGIRSHMALATFALTVLLALVMLALLRTGCDGWCSVDGARYGAALLLGALAMALVGAAAMRATGMEGRTGGLRLFLWIVVGQTIVLVYVFVRSALHAAVPSLPLTGVELSLPVLAAAVYLWATRPPLATARTPRRLAWAAVEMGLLVAVCVVVADRELPRLIMLSSDPDTHAYLAHQVELLGGIPWRGEAMFDYPAGTAAIGFVWAKLAFLDVRNAMTALPLLQSFLAALMLGEALASRIRRNADRLLLMLTALGVTAAGLLIPLFAAYGHMEGTGRQLAIATAAMVPALLLSRRSAQSVPAPGLAAMLLIALFALTVLNPVSIVVPIVLAIAYAIHVAVARRRISAWWLAAVAACPLVLLLDPYYFGLMTGAGVPAAKITISNAMPAMSAAAILADWQGHQLARAWDFLAESLAMWRGHAAPLFAIFVAGLLGLRVLLHPSIRIGRATLLAAGLAILALAAADGLFFAMGGDRRFYLLSPYYPFTLGQLKILLVTTLAASVIVVASAKRLRPWLSGCLVVLMVLMVHLGMHGAQKFVLDPRADHCGALGCLSTEDLKVIRDFERLHRARAGAGALGDPARVLVPNSVHDTAREDWVFPIAGARALPFYDVPPVAFFYYQGDDDYTTENYKAHVCRQFDRAWLKQQGVAYVFLPSVRGSACMQDMERLPDTEEILIQHGNSYLLRLL